MMDGTFTGVLDRVVDAETAVILLEADGEVLEELHVPVERLPEAARKEGAILSVTVEEDEFVSAELRVDETIGRRESMRDRLDRLSERLADRE